MISNNQVQQFQNQHFGKLTVIRKDGEFFFIGKEVADMLGYSNSRKALADHVEYDDRGDDVTIRDAIGRNQKMTVINESGLYSLILSSKLPQAKAFKHWVTQEILPSIRKYGGYIQNQEEKSNEEILANAILVAQNVIKDKESKIAELTPKAEYYDNLVDKNLLTNFRNTAKELHITQTDFIRFLLEEKYLYRDKNNTLLPYAIKNEGYFEIREWYDEISRKSGLQTLLTPKGRRYFMFLLNYASPLEKNTKPITSLGLEFLVKKIIEVVREDKELKGTITFVCDRLNHIVETPQSFGLTLKRNRLVLEEHGIEFEIKRGKNNKIYHFRYNNLHDKYFVGGDVTCD